MAAFNLPPDPDDYNDVRAETAQQAISAFANAAFGDDEDRNELEMVLSDLLCNLHHWSDRNGVDFDVRYLVSIGNYRDETTEGS